MLDHDECMEIEAPNKFQSDIDTQLAELYGQAAKASNYSASAIKSLASALGYNTRRDAQVPSVVALLEQANGNDHPNVLSAIKSYKQHTAELVAIREQEKPLEAIYNEQQWSRFFLCTNTNGHIHSEMTCSTCRWDTQFAWLPSLSGLTEEDAVEEYGAILCSVCFASAPVEWTNGENKKVASDRDARQALRNEKAAAKAAKAITNPDGSPLKGKWGTIATLVTAQRELVGAIYEVTVWTETNANHSNFTTVTGEYREVAERIIEAIATKTGESIETVRTEAEAKAAKKWDKTKKDWGI